MANIERKSANREFIDEQFIEPFMDIAKHPLFIAWAAVCVTGAAGMTYSLGRSFVPNTFFIPGVDNSSLAELAGIGILAAAAVVNGRDLLNRLRPRGNQPIVIESETPPAIPNILSFPNDSLSGGVAITDISDIALANKKNIMSRIKDMRRSRAREYVEQSDRQLIEPVTSEIFLPQGQELNL